MRDPYLYPDSDVLKNLAGIQDLEELKNMEADYTLLCLSSGIFDTEERIRQVILWNRKEKREHLPEEIREMVSLPEK